MISRGWIAGSLFFGSSVTMGSLLLAAALGRPEPPGKSVDYLRDVQPLLKAHCYQCHGVDQQSGGLRLDLKAAAMKGGAHGRAIVPGSSAQSLLLRRVLGQGGQPRMPLGFAPLAADQIALLRAWIDQGAQWPEGAALKKHWAYIKPVHVKPPKVHNTAWVRNPIDNFVLAKLEKLGLKPSPEAPKTVLIRRVYLDLIGLPPSVKEVDAFLADKSPNAYEKVVDRLLDNPHYGERWARPWLDLARYADTNGYEKDMRRTIWPYRDWVINAFNADMPYDAFTIEQIAGDLLPNATQSQKIATGFHRNTMYNDEGGVDREEQRWLTIVDRVGTTGSVWLGTTLACTQCHNHKYDPFMQKEFYQFFAFFDHCDEPELKVLTPEQEAKRRALQDEMDVLTLSIKQAGADKTRVASMNARLEDLKKQQETLSSTTTLVIQEKTDGQVPSTYMHIKGAYLNKGEKVTADVPAVLNKFPAGKPRNRLGLATWLVDPNNPLTARVEVNRIWETLFGRGIVETSEDFGTQGARPTHPELLDWLATEFVRRHWSRKAIQRLIVTSATYRQSSRVPPALLARDPNNALLARGPRFRMEAEMIRDVALSAAGLLSPKIGGPSVFPLQPDHIWNIPYNDDKWVTSPGEDRYRRSLYTFWRRTSPYPEFLTFDATSREFCTVRRIRTNTPLQALTTLNDPAFFEAARGLARRAMKEGGKDPAAQIAYAFRLCVARPPTRFEQTRLAALYANERKRYGADRKAAQQLTGGPPDQADLAETAAMTVVANVLLNLDETLTKE
ncbi:MAG TPA: PSD1 and planctomycete cytochrome C domain-containing protein [Chthonomonadaceae bacterium]|nr:PSD1 and planctomycete cytochrome C domain-containing protein [Chthonomonadaceae bacterium]